MGELSSVHLQCSEYYSDRYDPGTYRGLGMSEQKLSYLTKTSSRCRPEKSVTQIPAPPRRFHPELVSIIITIAV